MSAEKQNDLLAMRRLLNNAQNKTVEFLNHLRRAKHKDDDGRETQPLMYVTTPVMSNHYNYMHEVYRRMLTNSAGDVCDYTGGLVCTDLSSIAKNLGKGKQRLTAVPVSVELETVDQLDPVVAAAVRALESMNFEAHDISMNVRDDYINNISAIQAAYQSTLEETQRRASDAYRQADEIKRVYAETLAKRENDERKQNQTQEQLQLELNETRLKLATVEASRKMYENRLDSLFREKNEQLERLVETMSHTAGSHDGERLTELIRHLQTAVSEQTSRVREQIESAKADGDSAVFVLQQRINELETERVARMQHIQALTADYERRVKEALDTCQKELFETRSELNKVQTQLRQSQEQVVAQQSSIHQLEQRAAETVRQNTMMCETKMVDNEAFERKLAESNTRANEYARQLKELKEQVAVYEKEYITMSQHVQDCETLRVKANELNNEYIKAVTDRDELKQHRDALLKDNETIRRDLNATIQQMSAIRAEAKHANQLRDTVASENQKLTADLIRLKADRKLSLTRQPADFEKHEEPTASGQAAAVGRTEHAGPSAQNGQEIVKPASQNTAYDDPEEMRRLLEAAIGRPGMVDALRKLAVNFVTRLERETGREPSVAELIAHDVFTRDLERFVSMPSAEIDDIGSGERISFLDHFLQSLGDGVVLPRSERRTNALAICVFDRYFIAVQNKAHYLRSVRGPFKGFMMVLGDIRRPQREDDDEDYEY